jgi:hypothetical protein
VASFQGLWSSTGKDILPKQQQQQFRAMLGWLVFTDLPMPSQGVETVVLPESK